jgi:Serine protease inhibitor
MKVRKMSRKVLAATLALSMGVTMTGCNEQRQTVIYDTELPDTIEISSEYQTVNLTEDVSSTKPDYSDIDRDVYDDYYSNLDKAAFNIFNQCVQESKDGENILVSPASIQMALGMAATGAEGETLSEMEKVLGDSLKIGDINTALGYISNNMENAEGVEWNAANSIWMREDSGISIKPSQDYLDTIMKYYNADIFSLPFDDKAGEEMNAWVNKETKGMIPTIVEGKPDGDMHIMNALAFEGKWDDEYEDDDIIEGRTFTGYDGNASEVTMLSSTEDRYFEFGDGTGFIKNYSGGRYSFVGILPKEGVSLKDYIQSVADEKLSFRDAFLNADSGIVHLEMPEFNNKYENEMSSELQNLGMPTAFTGNAEFPGLNTERGMRISSVVHKTYIDVSREGTKAAAVTDVTLRCTGVMIVDDEISITLDRPFIYAIVDNDSGIPIFLGAENVIQ